MAQPMVTIFDELDEANEKITLLTNNLGSAIIESVREIIPDIKCNHLIFASATHPYTSPYTMTPNSITFDDLLKYSFPSLQKYLSGFSFVIEKKEEIFAILNALKKVEMKMV